MPTLPKAFDLFLKMYPDAEQIAATVNTVASDMSEVERVTIATGAVVLARELTALRENVARNEVDIARSRSVPHWAGNEANYTVQTRLDRAKADNQGREGEKLQSIKEKLEAVGLGAETAEQCVQEIVTYCDARERGSKSR